MPEVEIEVIHVKCGTLSEDYIAHRCDDYFLLLIYRSNLFGAAVMDEKLIKKVYVTLADNFEGRFFLYEAPVPISVKDLEVSPMEEILIHAPGQRGLVFFHEGGELKTDYFYRGKQIPIYPYYQHNGPGGGLSVQSGGVAYGLDIGQLTMPAEGEFCFSPVGSLLQCWSKKDSAVLPSAEFVNSVLNYYRKIGRPEASYLKRPGQ